MKKNLFLFVSVLVPGKLDAATMCVKLNAETPPMASTSVAFQSDWSVTELDGLVIKGVAVCGDVPGEYSAITDIVTVAAANQYCWCKIVVPSVSKWVFRADEVNATECAHYCGHHCATAVGRGAGFRQVIFSTLGG